MIHLSRDGVAICGNELQLGDSLAPITSPLDRATFTVSCPTCQFVFVEATAKLVRQLGLPPVLTPRQQLELSTCRAVMADQSMGFHPALANKRFGEMTDDELREVIAWHSQSQAAS
jgi:hypothetical protein